MRFLDRRPRDLDDSIAVVVFTVPEDKLASMDLALGPCVPLPGRKRPLRSPLNQHVGETRLLTAALYSALTGNPADEALERFSQAGDGVLSRCTDRFVDAMADANKLLLRLADEDEAGGDRALTTFAKQQRAYDRAWMAAGAWPLAVVGTRNRLVRMGSASLAREKGQPLYCWHGPSVPQFLLVTGHGPNPGKR
jgi:hypothetical protein